MARKAWSDLSPDYRHRLEAKGITARSHRAADLREGRGHTPPPRPGQAPADLVAPSLPTDTERAGLRAWRETLAPSWLPDREHMSDQTAAALSALRDPSTWQSVDLVPGPAGSSWLMTVNYTRGYPQSIDLPPDQYQEVLDLLALVRRVDGLTGDDGAWEAWVERGRDFDVHGTR